MLITLGILALHDHQKGLAPTAAVQNTLHKRLNWLQITTETKADGNYSSQLTVVNVEPGGLAGGDDSKIRMLLVRQGAESVASATNCTAASLMYAAAVVLHCHATSPARLVTFALAKLSTCGTMQNFGQHGRELITSEVAVRLLALLANDAELVKFCGLQGIPAARLLACLKHVAMKVRTKALQPCFSHFAGAQSPQRRRVLLADTLHDA